MLWEYSRGGNIPATPQEINRKAAQQGLDPIYDERMDPQTGFPADSKWRSDTIDHGHRVGGFAATSHGRDAAELDIIENDTIRASMLCIILRLAPGAKYHDLQSE